MPDGRVVNFPAGMTPQDIEKAIAGIEGDSIQATQPKADEAPTERSIGGFLGNAMTSTGRLIKDSAQGLVEGVKFLGKNAPMPGRVPEMAASPEARQRAVHTLRMLPGAIKESLVNRYGSVEKLKTTLYNDPAGVMADVSSLTGIGAGATAARAPKLAGMLRKVEQATDPLRVMTGALAGGAREAAITTVRGTLRPSAANRADFGGGRQMAKDVLQERVYSDASATRKLDQATGDVDALLAAREQAGTRGVPRTDIARSVLGEPKETVALRARLGVPDTTADLTDTAKRIFKNNPSEISLTDAQRMKREAQALAYEAGADNNTIGQAVEKAKAKALRAGIENRVPEVKAMNERSQRLVGSQRAFQEAQDRPRALTNFLSVLGGAGGFAGGGGMGAGLAAAAIKAMDAPRLGAMAGIGLNEFGRGINAKSLRQAALLARLTQGADDE